MFSLKKILLIVVVIICAGLIFLVGYGYNKNWQINREIAKSDSFSGKITAVKDNTITIRLSGIVSTRRDIDIIISKETNFFENRIIKNDNPSLLDPSGKPIEKLETYAENSSLSIDALKVGYNIGASVERKNGQFLAKTINIDSVTNE